jgi:hypothetical protein
METQKKTDGKDRQKNTERVVLNLTNNQAEQLNMAIKTALRSGLTAPEVEKISKRLEKTMAKNKIIETLRKAGSEPTKEQVDRGMIAAGVKKPKAVPEKAMKAIAQAVEEVEGEMDPDKRIQKLNGGCPGCGSHATLTEPDGTLLCEQCGAVFCEQCGAVFCEQCGAVFGGKK